MLIGWKESIEKLWSVLVELVVVSHPTSICMNITDRTMLVHMDIYLKIMAASELDNTKRRLEYRETASQ